MIKEKRDLKQTADKPSLSIRHSLKTRISLLVLAVIVAGFAIHVILYVWVMLPSIRNQENVYARKLVLQIRAAMQSSLNDLMSLNEDWSNWDGMYNAVAHWTPEFEKEAFPDGVYLSLHIDYIGVFDENHEPLFSRCHGSPERGGRIEDCNLSPTILRALLTGETHQLKGIFSTDDGPMFLSSMPIHRSDSSGKGRGFLVMGRLINSGIIARISSLVREKIRLVDMQTGSLFGKDSEGISIERSGGMLIVVAPLKDFFNRNVAAIQVSLERSSFSVLYQSTFVSMSVLLFSFVVLLIVVSVVIQRIALNRILRMTDRMDWARKRKVEFVELEENGQDEITLLQQSFNRLLGRIRHEQEVRLQLEAERGEIERFAVAGRVTANILHEINNPIRVIKNCLFAFERKPEENETHLALLKKEIRQLAQVTNQLLDFAGGKDVQKDSVDMCKLIRECRLSVLTAYPEGDYRLDLMLPDRPAIVEGDAQKLTQVLFNLSKNALEAMAFNGTITISLSEDMNERSLTVCVADDGPGVDPGIVDHLFEPYVTSRKAAGIGLGLFISSDIVRRHGGELSIDKGCESGACFCIRLPMNGEDTSNEV